MAQPNRKPSVVLTPAEKKQATADAKQTVKDLKAQHAALLKQRKEAEKAHAAFIKQHEKDVAAVVKTLDKAEQTLNGLAPAKAVPSKTA